MYLILRLFNSIIFVVANLSVALYTLQRFFRAMKSHYQLVDEVEEYSALVDQSRASLDYVNVKVMEAMKEMETDIGKEVYITHNLTKLSAIVAATTKRFCEIEEGIIELARLSHHMENATIETPPDINDEVRRVMTALKQKSPNDEQLSIPGPVQRPRSSRKVARSTRSNQEIESPRTVSPSKFSGTRSPGLVPEVMLLDEQHRSVHDKPIGFRPPWMCEI